MEESATKKKTVTRIVTPPKLKPIEPVTYPCAECGDPILDKAPCRLVDFDGVKKVACLECKKKK